ncbi:hypothetical protein AUG19_08400 [archaeon 13_1_20CM_2_54_9]|nr:MAG: hypothetical protein AUG19_08400 [archaeon 13_1_20CM_2_54_9]
MTFDMPSGRGKSLPAILSIAGIVLVLLGIDGKFTFAYCGPGALFCINNYSFDILAILVGTIVTYKGLLMYRRTR